MSEMLEKVALAIEEADVGYDMNLISLVDGVSTYRLRYSDGEVLEFGSTDEVYEHVGNKRRAAQAIAAVKALREPDDELLEVGRDATAIRWGFGTTDARYCWEAMIDSILSTPTTRGEVK